MNEIDVRRKAPNVWTFEKWVKKRGLTYRSTIDELRRRKNYINGGGGHGGHGGGGGDNPTGGTQCDFNIDFNGDFYICN